MLETTACSIAAWLLLAAASYRHRRDADVRSGREARLVRAAGWTLLMAALLRCGTDLSGERIVRLAAGASLGGVLVVVALSFWARSAFAPVRMLLRALRWRQTPGGLSRGEPVPIGR